MCGYNTPLGTNWRANRSPSTTRVWPALCPPLVADYQIHVGGYEISELAFALVTPLGADNYGRGHGVLLKGIRYAADEA